MILIINELFTNLFFNAGYIYADVVAIQAEYAATTPNYKNVGIYAGDVIIRFFWRNKFTKNFTYGDTVLDTE